MKILIIHLGILMTLLTIIYGLWKGYDYQYLIFKTIEVFFVWMIGVYVFQMIVKMIMNKDELREQQTEEDEEVPVGDEEENKRNVDY